MNLDTMTLKRSLPKMLGYATALTLLFAFVDPAMAADGAAEGGLGTLADNIKSNLGPLATLISIASYVVGIGFALAGMVKFKAHRDNPTQVPLSAPIVLLFVGVGLVFLPSIIKSAGSTIFGSGDKISAGSDDALGTLEE